MHRLTKAYPPDKTVLSDITLAFYPGAKIGVLGHNGSGHRQAGSTCLASCGHLAYEGFVIYRGRKEHPGYWASRRELRAGFFPCTWVRIRLDIERKLGFEHVHPRHDQAPGGFQNDLFAVCWRYFFLVRIG